MITQLYDQWIAGIFSPLSFQQVGEFPTFLGVSFAILGLCLVLLRRRHDNVHSIISKKEESLFPSLSVFSEQAVATECSAVSSLNDSSEHGSSDSEQDSRLPKKSEEKGFRRTTLHSGLKIVDTQFAADPHAFLRQLISCEGLALQELVSRANSLQLLTDSSSHHQSASCLELLRIAQQILKAASQRHATAELLLDDAEQQSLTAARALLLSPLSLETSLGSGHGLLIDTRRDWIVTTRELLDDVEQSVRIEAVG